MRVLLLPLALLGLAIAGCGSHVADETGDHRTDVGALADIELDEYLRLLDTTVESPYPPRMHRKR